MFFSIIQDHFFKQGVLNDFGKNSIIADRFTNRDPTLMTMYVGLLGLPW